jgi:uncharacterized protein
VTIRIQSFTLPGAANEPIYGSVYLTAAQRSGRTVIFCHGFKGFKDWGGWPHLLSALAAEGHICVAINFSHSGLGDSESDFNRLDLFRADRPSYQLFDLERVVAAFCGGELTAAVSDAECKLQQICLIGHSRGGIAVMETAAKCSHGSSALKQLSQIALLASVAHYPQPSAQERAQWLQTGVLEVLNSRTGQMLPLGLDMLREIESRPNAIEIAAQKIELPCLIIHGEKDPTVPVSAALELHTWIRNSAIALIPNADHVFGVRHPFAGTTEHFEQVVTLLKSFLTNS